MMKKVGRKAKQAGGAAKHAGGAAKHAASKAVVAADSAAHSTAHAVANPNETLGKVKGGATHVSHVVKDGATDGVHLVGDGAHAVVGGAITVGGAAAHAVTNPNETAHLVGDGVVHIAHTGATAVESGVVAVKGGVLETARFFADTEYRESEAIPRIKDTVRAGGDGVREELQESEEMVRLLCECPAPGVHLGAY
jgi:hypothetical protein